MKKKVYALLLMLVLVLSSMPAFAFAAEDDQALTSEKLAQEEAKAEDEQNAEEVKTEDEQNAEEAKSEDETNADADAELNSAELDETKSGVIYLDANGAGQMCPSATVIDASMSSTWNAGWYVASGNVKITSGHVACSGEVNLILEDGCNLEIEAANTAAGINVTGSNKLNIYAESRGANTGKLTVAGGPECAGIGGNKNQDGQNINIYGGVISAKSTTNSILKNEQGGAGIGGGVGGSGMKILIKNAPSVTATGSIWGAGIGGGLNGNAKTIDIINSTVEASTAAITVTGLASQAHGAGIGGGGNGAGEYITISKSIVTAKGDTRAANIGGGASGEGNHIYIKDGSQVYADEKASGEGLTDFYGGSGIGGGVNRGANDIQIIASFVWAAGARRAAGIGGGEGGDAKNILIKDCNGAYSVTATGNYGGAGIGGGNSGELRGLEINNSKVTADGGYDGAGIGGGEDGGGYDIKIINGSDVDAAGSTDPDDHGGAGIGGGDDGDAENILIEDSTVKAYGGTNASAIGGGWRGYLSGITIKDSEVFAQSNEGGAGIGGGDGANGHNINIKGEKTHVKACGGYNGAGIGGGDGGYGENINITERAFVEAYGGGGGGAGIGGGYCERAKGIYFSDCDVYAYGGNSHSDAIGSAQHGSKSENIKIATTSPAVTLYLYDQQTSYGSGDLKDTFYDKREARLVAGAKPKPTVHAHTWKYTASANIIKASCTITEPAHVSTSPEYLELVAPENTKFDGEKKVVEVNGSIDGVETPKVHYYEVGDSQLNAATDLGEEAPSAIGSYLATITLGTGENEATAELCFDIAEHIHDWEFTASGSKIIAECQTTKPAHEKTSDEYLQLVAPKDLTYNGSRKVVTVEGSIDGIDTPKVQYYELVTGSSLNATEEYIGEEAPLTLGSYVARITLGSGENEATAELSFEITKASSKGGTKTGDENTMLWFVLLAVAAAGIVAIASRRRKTEK